MVDDFFSWGPPKAPQKFKNATPRTKKAEIEIEKAEIWLVDISKNLFF